MTGYEEIKIAILGKLHFLAVILSLYFIQYFFAFITFGDSSSHFKTIMQAPGQTSDCYLQDSVQQL